MCDINCPNCEEEMEKVIGFPGYVWCRDCHITKEVGEEKLESEENTKTNRPREVTNEICEIIED